MASSRRFVTAFFGASRAEPDDSPPRLTRSPIVAIVRAMLG
jgi:hypothetical protein